MAIVELSPGRFAARFEDVVFHQVTIDPNTERIDPIRMANMVWGDYAFAEDFEIVVAFLITPTTHRLPGGRAWVRRSRI